MILPKINYYAKIIPSIIYQGQVISMRCYMYSILAFIQLEVAFVIAYIYIAAGPGFIRRWLLTEVPPQVG